MPECYLQRCTVFREFKILRDFVGFFFVVVACAGAVFYENVVVFSIDFEGLQVQCSCYARRQNVWRGPRIFLDDSSLLCFASNPAKAWRGWLYRQLGFPSRQLGRPFGGLQMSDFFCLSHAYYM